MALETPGLGSQACYTAVFHSDTEYPRELRGGQRRKRGNERYVWSGFPDSFGLP